MRLERNHRARAIETEHDESAHMDTMSDGTPGCDMDLEPFAHGVAEVLGGRILVPCLEDML